MNIQEEFKKMTEMLEDLEVNSLSRYTGPSEIELQEQWEKIKKEFLQ